MYAMTSDDQLLSAAPNFISVPGLLKAIPASENGCRYVYVEASNEAVDQQSEVVMSKALAESAEYYKQFGNIDIDHITQIGARQGIQDYALYEIGRPVDVHVIDGKTFLKGEIYSGTGPAAERANQFWSSLTEISPPARWYPSVGGAVLAKSVELDSSSGGKRGYITKVRWTNVAFSKTPVNQTVPAVQTVPLNVFAKCWSEHGLDFKKAKALDETDPGPLTEQQNRYLRFRDQMSELILLGKGKGKGAARLVELAKGLGINDEQALEWVERFLCDLNTEHERRKG